MKGNAINNVILLKFIISFGVPTVITHSGRQKKLTYDTGLTDAN